MAAEKFEKALLSEGRHNVDKALGRFETIRHSRYGRDWIKKKKMYLKMGAAVLCFMFLLIVLDEIGLGAVFLAGIQCGVL